MTTAKPEKAPPIHPDDLLGWSDLQYDPFCFVESWSLKLPTLVGQTYIIHNWIALEESSQYPKGFLMVLTIQSKVFSWAMENIEKLSGIQLG